MLSRDSCSVCQVDDAERCSNALCKDSMYFSWSSGGYVVGAEFKLVKVMPISCKLNTFLSWIHKQVDLWCQHV